MAIQCAFTGRLGFDAEAKTSQAGKSWTSMRVAVGSNDATAWVQVSVFGSLAATAAEFRAGDSVYIEGVIRLNNWTDRNGNERFGLAVVAHRIEKPTIGKHRHRRDGEKVSEESYHSPRSAPAGRLPASGNDFHDDEIPF